MGELDVGASGNVLINKDAYRLQSFNVWDYAEGHASYYRSMLVDLTQPHGEVSDFRYFPEGGICYTSRTL